LIETEPRKPQALSVARRKRSSLVVNRTIWPYGRSLA
jgi:hypothetical protein